MQHGLRGWVLSVQHLVDRSATSREFSDAGAKCAMRGDRLRRPVTRVFSSEPNLEILQSSILMIHS
jgi:hypothetical protein